MKKILTLSTAILLSTAMTQGVQAQNLSTGVNADTDTSLGVEAPVVGDTSVNTTTKTDLDADASTNGDTEARNGTMSDTEIRANIEAEQEARENVENTTTDAEDTMNDVETKAEAKVDAARGEAGTRIQDMKERTDTGVRATANTKIDMN